MTGHRAPLRSGVRDWDTRLPKRLQLFRGMRYPVQAPRTILNRNWSAGDSLPSFREANFGESNKGPCLSQPCFSQKSAKKYQHEETCSAGNGRYYKGADHTMTKSKARAKIEKWVDSQNLVRCKGVQRASHAGRLESCCHQHRHLSNLITLFEGRRPASSCAQSGLCA